jgi:hypothetical protein
MKAKASKTSTNLHLKEAAMSYSTKDRAPTIHSSDYMRRNQVIVRHVVGDTLYAYADMLAYSRLWPDTIEHNCETYKYVCNELMTDEAVGNYSGHSKYIKVVLNPPEGGVVMSETLREWLKLMQVKPEVIHALRLAMVNVTPEMNTSAYVYANAMAKAALHYGLDGVKHQLDLMLLWASRWQGCQARECKEILKA